MGENIFRRWVGFCPSWRLDSEVSSETGKEKRKSELLGITTTF